MYGNDQKLYCFCRFHEIFDKFQMFYINSAGINSDKEICWYIQPAISTATVTVADNNNDDVDEGVGDRR